MKKLCNILVQKCPEKLVTMTQKGKIWDMPKAITEEKSVLRVRISTQIL